MNKKLFLASVVLAGSTIPAHAEPELYDLSAWTFNGGVSASNGAYKKAVTRDKIQESMVSLSGNFLDQGGLAAHYEKTHYSLKSGGAGTEQVALLFSGHLDFKSSDATPARTTLRLDNHRIYNNDSSGYTDNVVAYAPQLSWLSGDRSQYVDLGLGYSRYQYQMIVRQFTPTLGFALRKQADWIQLRGYYIDGMTPARADGKSKTMALETKWTHTFSLPIKHWPQSMTVGVSKGERRYAIDMDEQTVANLDDLDKGVVSLGLTWELAKKYKLILSAKQSYFYSNAGAGDNYKLNSGSAKLTYTW
jgi:hypothetical protein